MYARKCSCKFKDQERAYASNCLECGRENGSERKAAAAGIGAHERADLDEEHEEERAEHRELGDGERREMRWSSELRRGRGGGSLSLDLVDARVGAGVGGRIGWEESGVCGSGSSGRGIGCGAEETRETDGVQDPIEEQRHESEGAQFEALGKKWDCRVPTQRGVLLQNRYINLFPSMIIFSFQT